MKMLPFISKLFEEIPTVGSQVMPVLLKTGQSGDEMEQAEESRPDRPDHIWNDRSLAPEPTASILALWIDRSSP